MMIIGQAKKDYIKVDNDLLKLSKDAYWVYGHFCRVSTTCNPTNEYMKRVTRMGMDSYKKAKKELINAGFLYVQRVGGRGANIVYHVGTAAVNIANKKAKK